jgi:hypothetical protein
VNGGISVGDIARRRKVLDREFARLRSQADQVQSRTLSALSELAALRLRAEFLLGAVKTLNSQQKHIVRRLSAVGAEARVLAQLWVERQ